MDEGLPSIHYGEIYTHYGVAATATISHVRPDLAPTLRFARPGDVIIAAVGETVEDVGKALAWLGTDQVAVHDDCFIFRSSLDPKYVVYFMQSDAFNRPKEAFVARAKVKRLSTDGLAKLRIPVPPLEVQHEIVRVLGSVHGTRGGAGSEARGGARGSAASVRPLSRLACSLLLREGESGGQSVSDVATFRSRDCYHGEASTTNGDVPVVGEWSSTAIYFHSVSNQERRNHRSWRGQVVYAGSVSCRGINPIFLTDAFSVHPTPICSCPSLYSHLLRARQERLTVDEEGEAEFHTFASRIVEALRDSHCCHSLSRSGSSASSTSSMPS